MAEAMHLYKALKELYAQKQKLEHVIASLEELRLTGSSVRPQSVASKRRGRKTMGLEERQEVSRRMKKYWASRRKRSSQAAKRS